jgi:hypothetical protein
MLGSSRVAAQLAASQEGFSQSTVAGILRRCQRLVALNGKIIDELKSIWTELVEA